MCDYSLHHVATRPARIEDKLVATKFRNSITRGFAAAGAPRGRNFEAEHPGGLGVDTNSDCGRYASVRLAAFVTAPSGQQPLKRPVVAQLLRTGWPQSLGLRASSQPTF